VVANELYSTWMLEISLITHRPVLLNIFIGNLEEFMEFLRISCLVDTRQRGLVDMLEDRAPVQET